MTMGTGERHEEGGMPLVTDCHHGRIGRADIAGGTTSTFLMRKLLVRPERLSDKSEQHGSSSGHYRLHR